MFVSGLAFVPIYAFSVYAMYTFSILTPAWFYVAVDLFADDTAFCACAYFLNEPVRFETNLQQDLLETFM